MTTVSVSHTMTGWLVIVPPALLAQLPNERLVISVRGDVLRLSASQSMSHGGRGTPVDDDRVHGVGARSFSGTRTSVAGSKSWPRFGRSELSARIENGVLIVPLDRAALRPLVLRGSARSASRQPQLPLPSPVSRDTPSLRDLVRMVNARKAEAGDELVLSIGADGRLRAMVEYS